MVLSIDSVQLTKSGDIPIRNIHLVDDSSEETLICKLWRKHTTELSFIENEVIWLKNAKTSIYKGVTTVSLYNEGEVRVSDNKRAKQLKEWYNICTNEEN